MKVTFGLSSGSTWIGFVRARFSPPPPPPASPCLSPSSASGPSAVPRAASLTISSRARERDNRAGQIGIAAVYEDEDTLGANNGHVREIRHATADIALPAFEYLALLTGQTARPESLATKRPIFSSLSTIESAQIGVPQSPRIGTRYLSLAWSGVSTWYAAG